MRPSQAMRASSLLLQEDLSWVEDKYINVIPHSYGMYVICSHSVDNANEGSRVNTYYAVFTHLKKRSATIITFCY